MTTKVWFYSSLICGVLAMIVGVTNHDWYFALLGGVVSLQAVQEDRAQWRAWISTRLRFQLEEALDEAVKQGPEESVRMFWARYQFKRDQQGPGEPFGPSAGVG